MPNNDDPIEALPPCELPLTQIDIHPSEAMQGQYTDFKADPVLTAQGWERRYTADPIRADEAIKLYGELGFEVHIEPVKPSEFTDACMACGLTACHTYCTVYTRKK